MTVLKFPVLVLLAAIASAQAPSSKEVESVYSDAHALYLDLHEHPELSGHETQTAAKLAERLRRAGYDVTEHVGGTGVVAILKNGPGPTIMLRPNWMRFPWKKKPACPMPARYTPKTTSDATYR